MTRPIVYAPHVDAIIYRTETRDFTRAQWLALAIAALDQAGANLKDQETVRGMFATIEEAAE